MRQGSRIKPVRFYYLPPRRMYLSGPWGEKWIDGNALAPAIRENVARGVKALADTGPAGASDGAAGRIDRRRRTVRPAPAPGMRGGRHPLHLPHAAGGYRSARMHSVIAAAQSTILGHRHHAASAAAAAIWMRRSSNTRSIRSRMWKASIRRTSGTSFMATR